VIKRTAAVVFWEIVYENDHGRRIALTEEFNLLREAEEWENWCAGQMDIIGTLGIAEPGDEAEDVREAMRQASIDVPGWRAAYEKRLRSIVNARESQDRLADEDKKKAVKRALEIWADNRELKPYRVAIIIQEEGMKRSDRFIRDAITPFWNH
jgi:hypothetical protein